MNITPFTCSAIYPFKLFWCALPSFGDIGQRDVCLLASVIELDGTGVVVLKSTFEKLNSHITYQKS